MKSIRTSFIASNSRLLAIDLAKQSIALKPFWSSLLGAPSFFDPNNKLRNWTIMKSILHFLISLRRGFILIALVLACLALSQKGRAACRQGCDLDLGNTFLGNNALVSNTTGSANTANGSNALVHNTTGSANTANGYQALVSNDTGSNNTASGVNALVNNTTASNNTANGAYALYQNTTGSNNTAGGFNALSSSTTASNNTANGYQALLRNTTGDNNTASGYEALYSNTTGASNTANGYAALVFNSTGHDNAANGFAALYHNTTGVSNTANGANALLFNTTGGNNTANGYQALYNNTTANYNTAEGYNALYSNTAGIYNTAIGANALLHSTTSSSNTGIGLNALYYNTTGSSNTAEGFEALFRNTTGASNIAIGYGAGSKLTTGSSNIDIGNAGVAAEARTTRVGSTQSRAFIAGVRNAVVAGGVAVYVSTSGQLGTNPSSKRFKKEIATMDKNSEAILSLRPVTFRYKKELDPTKTTQFGLIAEEVAKVNPDLVARDDKGEIYSVRYEAVNAMLLNEFLKEHRKVESLETRLEQQQMDFQSTIGQLQSALDAQAARLQEIGDHLEPRQSLSVVANGKDRQTN